MGRAGRVNAGRRGGEREPALLTLPADLHSVRAARQFVQARCVALGLERDRCDDALLLTSELVTNAVLHGRSEVCVEILRASDGRVRVAVHDENSRHPMPVAQDHDALDGRGLALVEALADEWGVDERPMGKAVWFELSLS